LAETTSVRWCSRIDKIKNRVIKKELNIYSVSGRIDDYIENQSHHLKKMNKYKFSNLYFIKNQTDICLVSGKGFKAWL
jgi:hypothetical protein